MAYPYTISEVIIWGQICQALQTIAINKQNALKGGSRGVLSPRLLYIVRKAAQYKGNDTSDEIKRYIIALCGSNYLFIAQNAVGGGSSVTPSLPTVGQYLIPITGADFANATDYDNPAIAGKTVEIWWSGNSIYLNEPGSVLGAQFAYTPTGIQITIPGFDASTINITDAFKIYILNP